MGAEEPVTKQIEAMLIKPSNINGAWSSDRIKT
jgi:hypothetical protein